MKVYILFYEPYDYFPEFYGVFTDIDKVTEYINSSPKLDHEYLYCATMELDQTDMDYECDLWDKL